MGMAPEFMQQMLEQQQNQPATPSPLTQAKTGLEDIMALLKPELQMRQGALQGYQDILSGVTDITQQPGYGTGLAQGQRAIEGSAAARGMQLSGMNLQDLSQFGQNYYQQQRSQALNELGSLAGMGMPALQGTTQAMGEIASLPMQQEQMRLAAQQGQAASTAGALGGIGSLLGGLALLSDERTKQDIKPIGKVQGVQLYSFTYRPGFEDNGQSIHVGVIAQEVQKTHPEAIITGPDGYLRVNYNKLFGG